MSRIEQIITEIEEYLDGCKTQPFTNNTKVIVDRDEMDELLAELRLRTPEEVKRYQKIISNKEAILSDAGRQADSILADAKKQAQELLDEHKIMQQAYAKADEITRAATAQGQQIVDQAVVEANGIRDGVIQYTDELLANMQQIIAHTMENTKMRFDVLSQTMESTYQVLAENRQELYSSDESDQNHSSCEEEDGIKLM